MHRNKKIYSFRGADAYFGISLAFESGAVDVESGAAGTACTGAESMTLPDARGAELAI
jgi:hypothetical protein